MRQGVFVMPRIVARSTRKMPPASDAAPTTRASSLAVAPLFLEQDHERDQRHQRHAHDAQRKLDDHQPPAAPGAVRAVMDAKSPRIGGTANVMPREEVERRTAMAQAQLLPLRQLIGARGRQRHARCGRHEHADAHRAHGRGRERHADRVGHGPKRHPYRKIPGEQKEMRARRALAALDARAERGADAAAPPASPTAASSQSS